MCAFPGRHDFGNGLSESSDHFHPDGPWLVDHQTRPAEGLGGQ